MADEVLIYISAASDLEYEREVLAKAIAEIPTSLGWKVAQTPLDDAEPDLIEVANANLHLLLLGCDVRAPVGLEWRIAHRAGHPPRLLLKQDVLRTQAGQAFMNELSRTAAWEPFGDAADLRRKALRILVDHIASNAVEYRIPLEELERLSAWQKEAFKPGKKTAQEPTRGGAGDSAVILSTERFTPSQGKLIKDGRGRDGGKR